MTPKPLSGSRHLWDHEAMGASGRPGLREPWSRHLAAIVLLFAVATLRWRPVTELAYLLIDEASYIRAFEWAAQGRSPYLEPRYLYPPALALLGGQLLALCDQQALAAVLRHLNLLGGCMAAWASALWLRRAWSLRVLIGALVVTLAPPIATGVRRGNLSLLAIGLALTALVLWIRRPLLGGLALGLSLVLKPLAAVVLPLLLLHRPTGGGNRHRLTALAATATTTLLLCFGWRYLPEMGSRFAADPQATRVTSLLQLLYWFGLEIPVWLMVMAVAVGGCALILLRPRSQAELTSLAVTAALLSLPLVWNHTMLLALPLQCMALAVVLERQGSVAVGRGPTRCQELILVVAAVTAIFLSNGFGAIEGLPRWLHGLLIAVPTLSPPALALYLARCGFPPTVICRQPLGLPFEASPPSVPDP